MQTCQKTLMKSFKGEVALLKKAKNPNLTPIKYFFKSIFNIIISELGVADEINHVSTSCTRFIAISIKYKFSPEISLGSFFIANKI